MTDWIFRRYQKPVRLRLMPDYEIRYACENDADAIACVLQEAFLEFKSIYTPEGFQATTPTCEQVLHRMSEGPIWVAILDQRVIATVSGVPKGKSLYVRSMSVHPTVRAKGIARALLDHVEVFAYGGEYESMVLSTTPFLAAAISLYERFGFSRSVEGPHDLYGTPLFTMVKKLTAHRDI